MFQMGEIYSTFLLISLLNHPLSPTESVGESG